MNYIEYLYFKTSHTIIYINYNNNRFLNTISIMNLSTALLLQIRIQIDLSHNNTVLNVSGGPGVFERARNAKMMPP